MVVSGEGEHYHVVVPGEALQLVLQLGPSLEALPVPLVAAPPADSLEEEL